MVNWNMKNRTKIYWPFAVCSIQQAFAYKSRFFLFIIGKTFGLFLIYYLWVAIYNSSASSIINGFTLNEMITYIVMSFITSNIIYTDIIRHIGIDITEGSIAINLIKPIDYKIRLLFHGIGNFLYKSFFLFIFIWLTFIIYQFISNGKIPPNVIVIFLYLVSLLLGFLTLFLFDFCFAMLSFYTTYIWGMNLAKNALLLLLSGQIIPLVFFQEIIQKIFNGLPFASINFIPVMIYLEKIQGQELFLVLIKQIIWVLILYLLSILLWNKAIKRLVVLGG